MSATHPISLEAVRAELSLRDLAAIFFRRLLGMSVVFIVVLAMALTWIFVIRDDLFQAQSKLLVRIGHEQAPSMTVLSRQTPIVGYRHQDIASEAQILSSMDLLGEVVDSFNLGGDDTAPPPPGLLKRVVYEVKRLIQVVQDWTNEFLIKVGMRPRLSDREATLDALSKALTVISDQNSNVITAYLTLPSREGTAEVLNAIINRYLEKRLEVYRETEVLELFNRKVETALELLRDSEQQLKALEKSSDIVNLEAQKRLLLEQQNSLRRQVGANSVEIQLLESKVRTLGEIRKEGEPEFGRLGAFEPQSFPARLLRDLAEIEKERLTLETEGLGNDRRLKNNRQRFDATLDLFEANLRSTLGETVDLRTGREATLAALNRELEALHDAEFRWRDLRRKVELHDREYQSYRVRLDEANATDAMERERIGNVIVIQQATDPIRPAGIRKLYLVAIAGLLAVLAAFAWAALVEFFDHRIYNARQLARYLGAPVAGVIPRVSRRDSERLVELAGG